MLAKKTSLFLVTMVLGIFHLAGCGGPLRPDTSMQASAGDSEAWNGPSLLLQLDTSSFRAASEGTNSLRVRVFALSGDATAGQEGPDQLFNLNGSGDFRIKVFTVGRKEFQLAIIDGNQKVLGSATLRLTVVPGIQRASEPVVIHVPNDEELVSIDCTFNISVNAGDSSRATTFVDVEPIFKGSCATNGCHDAAANAADINLSSFPFKSESYQDSQEDIVSVSLDRMNNASSPMPPKRSGGQLPAPSIKLVQKWFDGGLKDKPASDDPSNQIRQLKVCWGEAGAAKSQCDQIDRMGNLLAFNKVLNSFKLSKTYDFTFSVLGFDSVTLFEKNVSGYAIPSSKKATWQIDAEIKAPELTIPVVIIKD